VFPEMTLTGFSMNAQKAALEDSDLAFFSDLARRHSACVSFGGVQDGYNNIITMDASGKVISTHAKTHLFSFGGEDKTYRPGHKQDRFIVHDMAVLPAVCFDLRFPYLFWNPAEQTDLAVVIACWPASRTLHWARLLQARAIENQCYVVGVNRTGRDPLLEYRGGSLIVDPMGQVILDCRADEGVFVAPVEVDRDLVAKTRSRLPFLKARRPDFALT